jgi:hypothetical protein
MKHALYVPTHLLQELNKLIFNTLLSYNLTIFGLILLKPFIGDKLNLLAYPACFTLFVKEHQLLEFTKI